MQEWKQKAQSPAEVAGLLNNGQRLFVHGAAATPTRLLQAMVERADLEGLELYHLHLGGEAPFADPPHHLRFHSNSLFTGSNMRKAVAEGRADFCPTFLSDIPHFIRRGIVAIDVAVLRLSPPDRHGMCSLGTSVDAARAAVDVADVILAEINPNMPRTHGNTVVPISRVNGYYFCDDPLHESPPAPQGEVEAQIGQIVADLIPDRACLQMGIGAIPDAVLSRLGNKSDLGIHTEMFSDGILPLLESGVISNRYKEVHPGRTVTCFVSGTRQLYDYVDDNLAIEFHGCDRTNDTSLIRRNPLTHAINSALEIDLSGQVCADSIGTKIFSGIGGQMDFIRGASLSEGGKAIIALPSTASGGKLSRIVPMLKPGAGVVTTRGHVQWVVTEYGAVNLQGRNLRQRAEALISIAHPDFRSSLWDELKAIRHFC